MKILLLVAGGWISFMNQGRSLQAALASIGVKAELLFAGSRPSDLTHTPDLRPYKDHLVVPVGAWQDYGRLIEPALRAGCRVLPWIVADDTIPPEIVAKLNTLPWFLTTSNYCHDRFVHDGIPPEKIGILYETVDEDIWRPLTIKQQDTLLDYLSINESDSTVMPASFNLRKARQENVPILLTVGGDVTSKGALETIAALHKLNTQIPWLWIIKTLPYVYSFQCAAKEYAEMGELALRVKYIVGEFSHRFLSQLMSLCDIYVAPSRGEGFGLPLAEAQMCGKMVITHDATSTREVIVEGKTGLLARHHAVHDKKRSVRADVDSLAEQLHTALTNRALRHKLSEQARPIAIQRFGKESVARQFMAFAQEFAAQYA